MLIGPEPEQLFTYVGLKLKLRIYNDAMDNYPWYRIYDSSIGSYGNIVGLDADIQAAIDKWFNYGTPYAGLSLQEYLTKLGF